MSGMNEIEMKYRNKINDVINGDQLFRHYVNFLSSLTSEKSKYTYVCIVRAFMNNVNKAATELTFDDFNDYMSTIKYNDNGDTKTSSYLITVYAALKRFCEYLYVSKKIDDNYMLYIKRPKAVDKQSTIQKREQGYLTEKEIKKLLRHIFLNPSTERELAEEWKYRNRAIIYLFLYTGMRCSALCSVDINDIDFENKTLTVTDKGSKVRTYDMSDELCEILQDWIDRRDTISDVKTNALFITIRRDRITNKCVSKMVHTYAERCGIDYKNITPHKLRATYGTQLYNKTGDIHFVQECMGHNSPETTQLYIRGDRKNSKRASDIMRSIL